MTDKIIGPALPPGFKRPTSEENISPEDDPVTDYYGPQLPPHLKNKPVVVEDKNLINKNDNSSDDDDEVYGPIPADSAGTSGVQKALEQRALEIKLGYVRPESNEGKTREDWMVELPEIGKNLGLGPRQFRKNATADFSDRSSWTDTPGSKVKKKEKDTKKSFKEIELSERDKQQQKVADEFKKKRKKDKSLYDMHQDKLKKKKKKEKDSEEITVRTPFNREVDLKVNRFDEAQKKAILKKAQLLDDRFSQGQAKFL